MKIHKLVYLTWIGKIDDDKQINHRDDNKHNNFYMNLYMGTQKDNITDCINNKHRKGNIKSTTVYDKPIDKIITFKRIKDFIKYTNHNCINGSITHIKNKKWFKERYEIIGIK